MVHLTAEGLDAFFRQHPHARMLDVRFAFEREHGEPPAAHHVPWLRRDWINSGPFRQYGTGKRCSVTGSPYCSKPAPDSMR